MGSGEQPGKGEAAGNTVPVPLREGVGEALGEVHGDTETHTAGAAASCATCAAVSATSHTRSSSRSCGVAPTPYASPPFQAAFPL